MVSALMSVNKPRGQLLFRNTLYTASASMLWQVLAIITLPIQLLIISKRIEINLRRYLVKICAPIYTLIILYGCVIFTLLKEMNLNDSLSLLVLSLGISVVTSVIINILLTSRDEGLMLINKFHQLIINL